MNSQKEIEQMATILSNYIDGQMLEQDIDDLATMLYRAGYRKVVQFQSNVEFTDAIEQTKKDTARKIIISLDAFQNDEELQDLIEVLAKEYGIDLTEKEGEV